MPSASPLLNQFPSVLSDSECPYRYPEPSDCSYPAIIPGESLPSPSSSSSSSSPPSSATTAGHSKLYPTEYDPFKFLSAMAEQSLSGNFAASASAVAQHHHHHHHLQAHAPPPPPSCASVTNPSNFLFSPNTSQMQNGFTSPGPMTSLPPQFYPSSQSSSASSSSSSSACCMYSGGGGVGAHRPGEYSPAGTDLDSYQAHHNQHHQHQHQQQQQHHHQQHGGLSLNPGAGGGRGGGGDGAEGLSCRKSFFCTTEDLVEGTDSDSLLSWTRHHPEHWSRTEVLDWLFYVAQERGLDMTDFRGEAFQSLTGSQLCRMGVEDFTRLEPRYGALLYQMFKKLLSGVLFTKPASSGQPRVPPPVEHSADLSSPFSAVSCDSSRDSPEHSSFPAFQMPRKPCPNFVPPPETYWKQERTEWKQERSDTLQSDVIDIDSYDFDLSDPPNIPPNPAPMEPCPPEYEMFATPSYPTPAPIRTSCYYPGCPYPPQFSRRRPGRPRVKSLPEEDERASKDKKVKNQHLWEFIYETLLNPLYNPQYLRWENQREGVFRFVQSEAVAQLWGSRKNNENMTYEKLSRAMRHYYKRGILERVEGRRLVYKFSRKAMERAREKRHNSV
ncbi:uncharacterized protein LOC143301415 [Babylonia areolata]|uniref:uncharacterized protein LOC143301415 n=1 Tax=Babylonia areolata TaxID=304850 RepID=UPI003FD3CFC6